MAVFRRRRHQEGELEAETAQPGADEEDGIQQAGGAVDGPWDERDDVPPGDRVDLGSLQVPVGEDYEVQVSMTEEQAAWVTVLHGDSGLQLQAFAAPKSGGIWDEVRSEIADEVQRAGGRAEETVGRFGPELRARIADAGQPGAARPGSLEPVRFLGVDGPRWFLRGVITGPAAQRPELAAGLEDVFAGVVVVRGEHPVPPRDMLEISLPEDARQALAEQLERGDGRFGLEDPFERGPEITETR